MKDMLSHQTKAGAPWCPWRDVLEGGMEMLDIISDIAAWCLAGRVRARAGADLSPWMPELCGNLYSGGR